MTLAERKAAFATLGNRLAALPDSEIAHLARRAAAGNNWFDPGNVKAALSALAYMLEPQQLDQWLSKYEPVEGEPKKVGVVMAGNVPAVGFHDMLCVLIAGHTLFAKPSKEDTFLMTWLTEQLLEIEPRFAGKINFAPMLKGMDAMIATGSDNTARYFEYYFRNIPHIIRQNRSSLAIVTGFETQEELALLGEDIFRYYGLGCRNVAKLLVPDNYDFTPLLNALQPWGHVRDNHKYQNNYDYNKSIYLVNRIPHLDTGFLLLTESPQLVSPISVLYYEQYADQDELKQKLEQHHDKLQCVVSINGQYENTIPWGTAQKPEIWQYADNTDSLQFLGLLK